MSPPEKVIVGVVPEKLMGEADESVNAVAVDAPRPVTEDNVSASVAVRVSDPPKDNAPPPVSIPLELIVTDEFVRLELPMLLNVLVAPEIARLVAVPEELIPQVEEVRAKVVVALPNVNAPAAVVSIIAVPLATIVNGFALDDAAVPASKI